VKDKTSATPQASAWIDKECPTPIQWKTTRHYLVRRVQGVLDENENLNHQLAAEKATVLSLLSTIHDIRVAAKLPISTMLSEIPARIGELAGKL